MAKWARRSSSKYGNRRVPFAGKTFDSMAEAARYGELMILEKMGEIEDLECQPDYILQEKFERNGMKYRAIKYYPDFGYREVKTGRTKVEDVKGFATDVFKLKARLFRYKYPEIELRVIDV